MPKTHQVETSLFPEYEEAWEAEREREFQELEAEVAAYITMYGSQVPQMMRVKKPRKE